MDRPNILLITADQMRADCMGAAGHPDVQTPFLDTLANHGALFTHAHSAAPTCIPARAALFTGLSQRSHGRVGYKDGVAWNYTDTLPALLSQAGYHTHCAGKMHVWPPRALMGFHSVDLHDGFLPNRGVETQAGHWWNRVDDYLPWLREHSAEKDIGFDGIDCNSWVARPWALEESLHPTNWTAMKSVDFLRRRDPTKPFFLWTSFFAPHPPLTPPDCYFRQYEGRPLKAPVRGGWSPAFGAAQPDFNIFEGRLTEAQTHRMQAGYYGLITHVDHQVGRILRALKDAGVQRNTVILFTSDHGEMLGDHCMYRKSQPFAGSERVPMVLYDPTGTTGLAPQSRPGCIAELRDVLPTLLGVAGLTPPPAVEGRNLVADVQNRCGREYLHGEHTVQCAAGGMGREYVHANSEPADYSAQFIITRTHKYIWYSHTGREMLFNIETDPRECDDLAGIPENAALLETMRGLLARELAGRPEGYSDGSRLFTGRKSALYLG